jgi:hypothetical protein
MEGGMKSAGLSHQTAREEGDLREMSSSDTDRAIIISPLIPITVPTYLSVSWFKNLNI